MGKLIFGSVAVAALVSSGTYVASDVTAVGEFSSVFPLDIETNPDAGPESIFIGNARIIGGTLMPLDGELTVDAVGPNTEVSTGAQINVGTVFGSTGTLNVIGDGTAGSAIVRAVRGMNVAGTGFASTNGTANVNISNGGAVILLADPTVPGSASPLYIATADDVNGLDNFEAEVVVTGENSSLFSDLNIVIGRAETGASGSLRVLDGASVTSRILRDFGGGPVNAGSVQVAEGSELVVDGAGSSVETNRFLAGTGVFSRGQTLNPGNANAGVTVSSGGRITAGSNNQGSVIGWGSRSDMVVTGSGSQFNVTALPSDDNSPGVILGDEGDLIVGLTSTIYDFSTDSYEFIEGAGTLAIQDNASVSVEDEVRIGGTDTFQKTLIEDFYPDVVVPSSSGIVEVSSGGQLTATRVIVGENGTLMGDGGTINADVVLDGGTIAPGMSPGVLDIFGDLTIFAGILDIEIAGSLPGQYDILNISGDLFANDPFDINVSFLDGFMPSEGAVFDFFNVAGDTSSLETLFANSLVGFNIFGLDEETSLGFDLSNGRFSATALSVPMGPTPVPVPASLPLLIAGLSGLGFFRRYGRKKVI